MEGGAGHLCAWCFDLLELNGYRERKRALIERKAMLRQLLIKADDHVLRYSDEFANAEKLLAVATKQGLEGIVSKKATQQYVSGKNVGWIKVKTATWREAKRGRWELFQNKALANEATLFFYPARRTVVHVVKKPPNTHAAPSPPQLCGLCLP